MKPAGRLIPADEIKEIIIPNTPAGRYLALAIQMAERKEALKAEGQDSTEPSK